jgi:hypothetical protein
MNFREYIGEENAKKLHKCLDEALDSEGGFVFISNGERITDAYKDVCAAGVLRSIIRMVNDAISMGLVVKDCGCSNGSKSGGDN